MKVELSKGLVLKEGLMIPVFDYTLPQLELEEEVKKVLTALLAKMKKNKKKEAHIDLLLEGELMTFGLYEFGKVKAADGEKVRRKGAKLTKLAKDKSLTSFSLVHAKVSALPEFTFNLLEGVLLVDYSFDEYKSKEDKSPALETVTVVGLEDTEALQKKVEELEILVESTHIARDLINEPANIMTPKHLAKYVEYLGKELDMDVSVFKKDKIKELKMNAYLSVARGSENKPRFIVMRHFGAGEQEQVLGLIGKGLTYDAGGYSIKPTAGMKDMKADMGGAAAVIGAMNAIVKNNLPINVVAVVAACENMISGDAYRPGDIIGSMSGQTIEVLNTDAEGRLTMADALTYIQQVENVDKVVDIATLTGAKFGALGNVRAGILSNDDDFVGILEKAGDTTGELVWRFPADDDYNKLIESKIADMKNVGPREGGAITAGLFVKRFLEDDRPWIHIDIAGNEHISAPRHYMPEGGTGFGARLLYEFVKEQSKA